MGLTITEREMEAKHTQGPWYFDKETDEVTCTARANKACIAQVETGWDEPFEIEQQANARLIAAAPELLEALQEVVAISDRKHDAWDKAHAAIAKALGHNA